MILILIAGSELMGCRFYTAYHLSEQTGETNIALAKIGYQNAELRNRYQNQLRKALNTSLMCPQQNRV
jgi:hypothetical protein